MLAKVSRNKLRTACIELIGKIDQERENIKKSELEPYMKERRYFFGLLVAPACKTEAEAIKKWQRLNTHRNKPWETKLEKARWKLNEMLDLARQSTGSTVELTDDDFGWVESVWPETKPKRR